MLRGSPGPAALQNVPVLVPDFATGGIQCRKPRRGGDGSSKAGKGAQAVEDGGWLLEPGGGHVNPGEGLMLASFTVTKSASVVTAVICSILLPLSSS